MLFLATHESWSQCQGNVVDLLLSLPTKALGIKLSPAELGALIHELEDDGDGMVSCPKFLLTFSRIGE